MPVEIRGTVQKIRYANAKPGVLQKVAAREDALKRRTFLSIFEKRGTPLGA